jgi:transcriptional regulator GlxA family with amidase domain
VDKNLLESIHTRQVAAHLHLSEQYFCKVFKKATGQTFVDYLSRERVKLAQRLLQKSNRKIADIAHAVGFQSLAQFNRSFKRIVGQTPVVDPENWTGFLPSVRW